MKAAVEQVVSNAWVELGLRWLVGATFLVASLHKITSPEEFARIIYGYSLFPHTAINPMAVTIPFLELFAGAALILGIYPRAAALIINLMLIAFITAISINLALGVEFDCGCLSFGTPGQTSSPKNLLLRDIGYLVSGLWVLLYPHRRKWCLLQTGGLTRSLTSGSTT